MTTIYVTTIAEYNYWLKFKSKQFQIVLLNKENDKQRFELYKSFRLNSIPNGWTDSFGTGIYKLLEMFRLKNEGRPDDYYALANYKPNITDEFNPDLKVEMYLNPLLRYKSVGRKDFNVEQLLGSTLEVIGSNFVPPDTKNLKSPMLHYSWRFIDYPIRQDNAPQPPIDNDDEMLLAVYGY